MLSKIEKVSKKALDFILPLRCPVSGELVDQHGALSSEAWAGLEFIEAPQCIQCGIPFKFKIEEAADLRCAQCLEYEPAYDMARARFAYNDTSRSLLLKFKHGDQMHLVKTFTPHLMRSLEAFKDHMHQIAAVPLHPFRLLRRKYNQAGLLAQALAKESAALFDPFLLQRVKHTKQQEGKFLDRRKNVRKAFEVKEGADLSGQNIVLVDDVFTSGATANACAKALKRAGASKVYVLTLARVVYEA